MTFQRLDAATERRASLNFALLGAAQQRSKNPFRTAEWIQANVEGYPQPGDGKDGNAAFRKQLQRDVDWLVAAGVPIIHITGSGTEPTKLMIELGSYTLPEIEFTPEEAVVMGLAGGVGQEGGLSVFSQTGWTKIAAAGTNRTVASNPGFTSINDLKDIKPRDFQIIIQSIDKHLSLSFDYHRTPTATPENRHMDPWGLVPQQGRVYLVGWDLDKSAPRSFRITRVRKVARAKSQTGFHPPTESLADIVSQYINPSDLVDALVRIPPDTALEISSLGTRRENGLVVLKDVSADWLARTAVGYAPEVEVIEPVEVRNHIKSLLGDLSNHGS